MKTSIDKHNSGLRTALARLCLAVLVVASTSAGCDSGGGDRSSCQAAVEHMIDLQLSAGGKKTNNGAPARPVTELDKHRAALRSALAPVATRCQEARDTAFTDCVTRSKTQADLTRCANALPPVLSVSVASSNSVAVTSSEETNQ